MTKAVERHIFSWESIASPKAYSPSGYFARILISIPCYNEEMTIGSIVLKAKRYSDDVLVIDDGSSDATAGLAQLAGAMVISHINNRGKAASILTAVRYAREQDYDALVLLDGDGQHNVDEIPALLDPIFSYNADMVIGSRFLRSADGTNGVPSYRRLGQITLDLVTNATSPHKSSDSQSGFRALSRKALANFNISSEGYNIESDMITHFANGGYNIREVPISVRYDIPNGHKKHSLSHGFDILSHVIGFISYKRPMLAFGIPGIIFALIGVLLGVYTFSTYYTEGVFHYIVYMVSMVTLILGLLLVITGLIMNSLSRVFKSPNAVQ